MIHTPSMPRMTAAIFQTFIRSPKNVTAKMAVQIGIVNSIEITCAIGIMVSATSQAYCAP